MTTTAPPAKHRGRWVIVLLAAFFLLLASLFALWVGTAPSRFSDFEPPEMAAARYTPRDVVGNLGGMAVTIPRHMAEYVEYDGDPGWGEKRKGPRPQRTHESRLSSFGFDVRYPDMATLSEAAMFNDKRKQSIYETRWISVSVTSGSMYPGDGFMDRAAKYLEAPHGKYPLANYEKLPELEHDLTVYVVAGVDPRTMKPYREDKAIADVYVHKEAAGHATAIIRCNNAPHAAALCIHQWSMEHEGVKCVAKAQYRRGLLTAWRDIQQRVSQTILAFETPAPVSAPLRGT